VAVYDSLIEAQIIDLAVIGDSRQYAAVVLENLRSKRPQVRALLGAPYKLLQTSNLQAVVAGLFVSEPVRWPNRHG